MSVELDLHGVRHGEVQNKIDKFIGLHLMRGTTQVSIITETISYQYS